MASADFLTDPADLLRTRWSEGPRTGVPPGSIVVALDRFALTANNLTYAKFGNAFRYWDYFPAPPGWGRVPVWGIGRVIQAGGDGPAEGERGFVDAAPHRAQLPPTYNEYVLIDRDPDYDETLAAAHLVLRPLFSLGFFLAGWLEEEGFFGAERVIVSSASSKAALALAYQLRGRIGLVGLTSPGRLNAVAAAGLFDRVIAYSDIPGAPALNDVAAIFADIAGDPALRRTVHASIGPMLVRSIGIGATRGADAQQSIDTDEALAGPRPEFFFAPAHILRLRERWGAALLRERLGKSWTEFLRHSAGWLRFAKFSGKAEIARVYDEVARGTAPSDTAAILVAPHA